MILAGVGIVVAAFFLLRRDFNTAFVIAVLGMVAWFLNYRAQMREIIAAADAQENRKRDDGESCEDADDD
jgi:preprotein translocase subunit SecF